LTHWLKKCANYPLGVEHVKSVRLMKGKNGIHLDNKEHAILEHCLSLDRKKLSGPELSLMLVLDPDYIEEAEAHQDSTCACKTSPANPDLDYIVHFL
jgi:hypothetical protein